VLEAGGFESGLRAVHAQGCEDLLRYFRISERYDFAVVPEYLTGYRRHPETMSEDSLQMLWSYQLVTKEMYRKYPQYAEVIQGGRFLGFMHNPASARRHGRMQALVTVRLAGAHACSLPLITNLGVLSSLAESFSVRLLILFLYSVMSRQNGAASVGGFLGSAF